MKKLILSIGIISNLIFVSPKAEAIVGLTSSGPMGAAVVFEVVAGGALEFFAYQTHYNGHYLEALVTGALGLILLEKDGGNQIEFKEVSDQSAGKFGITKEEMEAYNKELPRVNAIVAEMISAGQNLSEDNRKALLKSFWNENLNQGEISSLTVSAIHKMLRTNI